MTAATTFAAADTDLGQDVEIVASPCVRQCTLGDDEVCVGCGRSLAEIKAWGGADTPARRAILAQAEARLAARAPRWPWSAALA